MSLEFAALAVAFAFGLFVVYCCFVHHHEWERWRFSHTREYHCDGHYEYSVDVYKRYCKTCGTPQMKEVN